MGWDWLKHAFAVEGDDATPVTDAERLVVERVCREVVRRGLAIPALMALETTRPLHYVGAQAIHFFQPMLAALVDVDGPRHFATFLERRRSIDRLCETIEAMQRETSPTSGPPSDRAADPPRPDADA